MNNKGSGQGDFNLSTDSSNVMNSMDFVSVKVKSLNYCGKPAVSIYMQNISKKIRSKIHKIQIHEERIEKEQAASYKSSICHELRTPLQMAEIFTR